MFGINNLAEYIKKRDLRLRVKIPVFYSFRVKAKEETEYKKCVTINISTGGISIKDDDILKEIKHPLAHKPVLLKFIIPRKKDPLKLTGIIEWHRIINNEHHLGIAFEKCNFHDILDIMSYALRIAQWRLAFQTGLIVLLVAGIFAGTVWALNLSKTQIKQELLSSESARKVLAKEVDKLLDKKDKLELSLKKNGAKLEEQQKILKENKEDIKVFEYILKEVGEEWNIESEASLIILDKNYRSGKEALKDKQYDKAIRDFEVVVKKFPDSSLAYKMLYKTLYESGKREQAESVFQKYIQITKKEIFK